MKVSSSNVFLIVSESSLSPAKVLYHHDNLLQGASYNSSALSLLYQQHFTWTDALSSTYRGLVGGVGSSGKLSSPGLTDLQITGGSQSLVLCPLASALFVFIPTPYLLLMWYLLREKTVLLLMEKVTKKWNSANIDSPSCWWTRWSSFICFILETCGDFIVHWNLYNKSRSL